MAKITRILGILCMVVLASCARNLDPIEKSEIISKSKEDIKKIDAIKNSNLNWEDEIEIDLYTAIALAIKNNKGLTPLHVSAICKTIIVASNIVDIFPNTINQKDNDGKTACFMSIFLYQVDNPWIINVTNIMKGAVKEGNPKKLKEHSDILYYFMILL